jgi:hypothetical protein
MKNQTRWIWGIIFFIACLCLLWPLFRHGFYVSDDGEWMVIRLSAFYQSLAQGQFPVRFLNRLNNSYGYPVANFLYPGFLYIGSLLHVTGLSFVDSVKCIFIASIVGSTFFIYKALRIRFTSFISTIGTIAYLGFPYLTYDIYSRGSVGEILALLPVSILFYSFISEYSIVIPFAVAFLIVSHNTFALLFLASFCFLWFIKGTFHLVMKPICIGIGMASFFWIPAILEQKFVKFSMTTVADPSQYFIRGSSLYLLSVPTLFALCMCYVYRRKLSRVEIAQIVLIGIGYVLSLSITQFLWSFNFLRAYVQFPFRFLAIPMVFGSWVVAYAVDKVKGFKQYAVICIFGIFWICGIVYLQKQILVTDRPSGYYDTNEGTTTVRDEYLPRWVNVIPEKRPIGKVELISGDAQVLSRTNETQRIDMTVIARDTSNIQINTIYYPGWGITIDGMLVPVSYLDSNGLMRVTIPAGTHHVVSQFRETVFRFISDITSFVFCMYYVFVLLQRKKRL